MFFFCSVAIPLILIKKKKTIFLSNSRCVRKTLEFNDADSIAKNAKYWKPQKKRPKKLYIKKWEKTQAYWWLLFYVLVYSHFIFFFWIWCVCLFVCLFVFFIIKMTNEKKKRTFHRMTAKIKENKGRWKSGTKKLFVSQKRRLCIPFQVCFFFFSLLLFFYLLPRKKKNWKGGTPSTGVRRTYT